MPGTTTRSYRLLALFLALLLPGLSATPARPLPGPPPAKTAKKLAKFDKVLAKTVAKQEAAKVELARAQVEQLAAQDDFLATSVALLEQVPGQLKAAKKAHKAAARALKRASRKAKKWSKRLTRRAAKRDRVLERILGLDPDHFAPPPAPAVGVIPLLVHEALPPGEAGVDRTKAVATFGVPFAQDQAVPVVDGSPALGVSGAHVYQLRALDTWPDGSARWVLCDVQTDLAAGEIVSDLALIPGSGQSGTANLGSTSADYILLDSGPLQALIDRNRFNLLQSVVVDDKLIGYQPESFGLTGKSITGETLRPASNTHVWLEENGPARAVARADGTLLTLSGQPVVDFTCRITARAGRRDVEVTFTVRNANLDRPAHVAIESIELSVLARPGPGPQATLTGHDGVFTADVDLTQTAHIYQAYSTATTTGTASVDYEPHLPRIPGSQNTWVQEGYEAVAAGHVLHALGNRSQWPAHPALRYAGTVGGATVAIEKMPYLWPAALEVKDGARLVAGLFTSRNPQDYTFAWKQHESRTALYAFHTGTGDIPEPQDVAARLDMPVVGRCADYLQYDRAGVFAYRLVSDEQHDQAYAAMGITHDVGGHNSQRRVTRYLYKGTSGGTNNHASIEAALAGSWMRYGMGGTYLNALDLALYKSEWQISRSDGFHDGDDPGPDNPGWPHSTGFASDDEHRYREGVILAWFLTGDPRFRDALLDETEVLTSVSVWPHERSMAQTLRAMALVGEFADNPYLLGRLRERLAYIASPTIDVDAAEGGWGWQDDPDAGDRRYYVNSSDNQDEQPPGENFQSRGFISASLGPLGYYHAARVLEADDPVRALARGRLRDLSWWTRQELFPTRPDPADQRLAYSYAVSLQQVTVWENVDFHPILLGMAESYLDTGDVGYLDKGVEQLRAAEAHGDLDHWDVRLDVQHFLDVWLEWNANQ